LAYRTQAHRPTLQRSWTEVPQTAGSPCGTGSRCAQWPGGDAEPGYPMHRLHSIFSMPGAIGMPAAAMISALVFRSDGRFGTAWQIASFWLGLATVASGPIVATRGDRRCQRAAAACCDVAGSRLGDGGIRQAVLPHPRRPSDCMVPATRRLPNGTDWHETDWAARMASATRTGRHRTIPAGLADTNAVMIRRLELQRLPAQEEPRSERISGGRSARCYPARYPTPADRSTPFFGGWMGALHGLRFRPDRPPRWSAQRPLSAGELAGHRT
jgi:hypothetical protein